MPYFCSGGLVGEIDNNMAPLCLTFLLPLKEIHCAVSVWQAQEKTR